jgi:hypothetical protein
MASHADKAYELGCGFDPSITSWSTIYNVTNKNTIDDRLSNLDATVCVYFSTCTLQTSQPDNDYNMDVGRFFINPALSGILLSWTAEKGTPGSNMPVSL